MVKVKQLKSESVNCFKPSHVYVSLVTQPKTLFQFGFEKVMVTVQVVLPNDNSD